MADVATRKPIPLVNNIIPDSAINTLNLKVVCHLVFYIVQTFRDIRDFKMYNSVYTMSICGNGITLSGYNTVRLFEP